MKSAQKMVSIGMPVYNGARYIRDAINSLLIQSYEFFELIISDNASTDETEQICRELAAIDKRIKYYRQPLNQGAHSNFQFVLDHAVGSYFMWAAHDDTWCKNFISAGVHALSQYPTIIAAAGIIEYRSNNRLVLIDAPPYLLDGAFEDRVSNYLNTNLTDYLFYGIYRTEFLAACRLQSYVYCPEKIVIIRAILSGGYIDAPDMKMSINYNLRTRDDLKDLGINPARWQELFLAFLMAVTIFRFAPPRHIMSLIWLLLKNRTPGFRRILRGGLKQHNGRLSLFVD